MRVCVKEENDDFPPGFESFSSVILKREKDEGKEDAKIDRGSSTFCSTSTSPSKIEPVHVQMEVEQTKTKGVTRSLRRRMGVKYNACDSSSGDEIVCEKVDIFSHHIYTSILSGSGFYFCFQFHPYKMFRFIKKLKFET